MMAEEVLIVKLKDMSQQEQVRTAIEKRIETQKTTFEGYGVEQFELLTNNAVVEVRGNFVLFIVNANSAEAQKAFLKAL
jgi:trehalose-6-phosphatase